MVVTSQAPAARYWYRVPRCGPRFVSGGGHDGGMGRRRVADAPRVVHRTARCGLRASTAQRRRLFGLLVSAGDVWACVLELNAFRRHQRKERPLTSYPELCRELAASGPRLFGELDSVGARSVLRRFSDAWLATARRRKAGDMTARYPRRRRRMMPVRWYAGTFRFEGRVLQLPVARGCPPLKIRLDRDIPYPPEQVRSVTLLFDGRLQVDVTAEVPVAVYRTGHGPDPGRIAGVDLGVIHPFAVAGTDGRQLLVSGRAIRAEHRQHLRDTAHRDQAVARRTPGHGQRGSRRWRQYRRRRRVVEGRHRRRVSQAHHEAAKTVVEWAVENRVGTLVVGDPRGVLRLAAGRIHNKRLRDWSVGQLMSVLHDKAEAAGITVKIVDERGTSSTCPACSRRVPKPAGRTLRCPRCGFSGHRDLVAAASIAARGGGTIPDGTPPSGITHRRAGTHLPGVSPARRDPRRPPSSRRPPGSLAGTGPPRARKARGVAHQHGEELTNPPGKPRRTNELVH
jgi:IS605 OrfB family transposase